MPATHVALLRGINVGRAKRIAMADLKQLVEALGASGVRTIQNSGNVLCTASPELAKRLARSLEAALARSIGVDARVTVIGRRDLGRIISGNPLREAERDPTRTLVVLPRAPADRPRLAAFVKRDWSPDRVAMGTHAAYVWCAKGILESRFWTALSKELGDGVTTRNWATMTRLLELAEEPGGT